LVSGTGFSGGKNGGKTDVMTPSLPPRKELVVRKPLVEIDDILSFHKERNIEALQRCSDDEHLEPRGLKAVSSKFKCISGLNCYFFVVDDRGFLKEGVRIF
jgi:hypothetical protein